MRPACVACGHFKKREKERKRKIKNEREGREQEERKNSRGEVGREVGKRDLVKVTIT